MDDHFRRIELPITIQQFRTLPRNTAYKYEYLEGRAVLTPRPKGYTAVRDLSPVAAGKEWRIEPLPPEAIPELDRAFNSAHFNTQPFASLDGDASLSASRDCLEKTLSGKDGPIVPQACFQVFGSRHERAIGAALVTLQPDDIATNPFCMGWKEDAPADAVEKRLGCPHLTWIFVSHWEARHGAGTALLAAVVKALSEMGYRQLASTFLLGSDSSVLWHWKNGFRLIPRSGWFEAQLARNAPAAPPA